jgi:glutamate carboxypeptidase
MAISASRKLTKYSLVMAAALMLNGTAQAADPTTNKVLFDRATQARPEVLKLLESLVNIDSGTGSEKGLELVGGMVADEARKLGMQVEFSSAAPAVGKNLVATLKGRAKRRSC